MKKLIALLLAAAMLLTMTACGGAAEPVETTPATTEAPTTPTEDPTEEPTEAPTEAPRVAPTDFETVDPATLPEPVPVEEQLQSEDTQTVTLGSLEEYEDLLWELGFKEVRLAGTHESYNTDAYCEPVGLTYNEKAFRFDFTYCRTNSEGKTTKEEGWSMYGTKSVALENVSAVTDEEYYEVAETSTSTIVLGEGQTIESFLQDIQSSEGVASMRDNSEEQETEIETANYEEEFMQFASHTNYTKFAHVKAVYYPVTGNLYNYMCDPNSEGQSGILIGVDASDNYQDTNSAQNIGFFAQKMCFHYLFPAEDAAE